MKTREEIERVYDEGCRAVWAAHEPQLNAISAAEAAELDALAEKRKAALAELDDPMLRLIAAAKKAKTAWNSHQDELGFWHYPSASPVNCGRCDAHVELRYAIDYAEQRRAQA